MTFSSSMTCLWPDGGCHRPNGCGTHGSRFTSSQPQASFATFVTSMSTVAAFFFNLWTTIPALRFFSVFMCLMVGVNYVFVCVWFPFVLQLWSEAAFLNRWSAALKRFLFSHRQTSRLGQDIQAPDLVQRSEFSILRGFLPLYLASPPLAISDSHHRWVRRCVCDVSGLCESVERNPDATSILSRFNQRSSSL